MAKATHTPGPEDCPIVEAAPILEPHGDKAFGGPSAAVKGLMTPSGNVSVAPAHLLLPQREESPEKEPGQPPTAAPRLLDALDAEAQPPLDTVRGVSCCSMRCIRQAPHTRCLTTTPKVTCGRCPTTPVDI